VVWLVGQGIDSFKLLADANVEFVVVGLVERVGEASQFERLSNG